MTEPKKTRTTKAKPVSSVIEFTPEKLSKITLTNRAQVREIAAALVLNGWTSKEDWGGIRRYDRPNSFFVAILPAQAGANGPITHYDIATNYQTKELTYMELLVEIYDTATF